MGSYLKTRQGSALIHVNRVQHPGPYFWRLYAFSQKNKVTLDKVSYGSSQKCSN